MVSEDKIIKQGIRQTEAWFKQFKNQVENDLSLCDTYKEFLERTEEYTTGNILVSSGYSDNMQDIIVKMLNDIKFKRAAQRELIEQTIRYNVGNLITDVGEDIKQTTRQVVSRGYDEGIHPKEIAKNITHEIDSINHKRARTIARTEVKRADTIANYVIAKEDGATGFTVECRPDCCPYCAEEYDEHRTFEQQKARLQKIEQMKRDKIDDPLVRGKGEAIGGNKKFNIKDTSVLPPFHPNCRCTVYYIYDDVEIPRQTTEESLNKSSTLPAQDGADLPFKPNNEVLKGIPTEYEDVDDKGEKVTVYKYENIELAFNENAKITHEELRDHINSLPKAFNRTNAKRIYIHDYDHPQMGGVWKPNQKEIHIYSHNTSKEYQFNTFNHEFAHSIDIPRQKGKDWEYIYSHPNIYESVFEKDNELGYSSYGVIEPEFPIKFVTSYAGRSYFKFSKNPDTPERLYSEDFAESSMKYLNPNTHDWFVKEFPHRANLLEAIYGKPDFKHSIFNKLSDKEKITTSEFEFKKVQRKDIYKWYDEAFKGKSQKLYDQKTTTEQKITSEKLTVRMYKGMAEDCDTDECYKKYHKKVIQAEIKVKQLEEVVQHWYSEITKLGERRMKFMGKLQKK